MLVLDDVISVRGSTTVVNIECERFLTEEDVHVYLEECRRKFQLLPANAYFASFIVAQCVRPYMKLFSYILLGEVVKLTQLPEFLADGKWVCSVHVGISSGRNYRNQPKYIRIVRNDSDSFGESFVYRPILDGNQIPRR